MIKRPSFLLPRILSGDIGTLLLTKGVLKSWIPFVLSLLSQTRPMNSPPLTLYTGLTLHKLISAGLIKASCKLQQLSSRKNSTGPSLPSCPFADTKHFHILSIYLGQDTELPPTLRHLGHHKFVLLTF